jgi:hypothetical protein
LSDSRHGGHQHLHFGAGIFGRQTLQLLELAREGKINLTVSEAILDETGGVLASKFNWVPGDVAEARRWITGMARTVKPAAHLDVIKERSAG